MRFDVLGARRTSLAALAALAAAATLALTACAPEPEPTVTTPPASVSSPSPTPVGPTIAPFPTGHADSTTALPTDCTSLLTGDVLAELEGVPLNAEGMGGGIRPDSSRVCVWGDPGAAATYLVTVFGYAPEREARDALYALGQDGFTCYEPRGGVRCEKTWEHETLPITQGRTLFYRDGVIVDTQYSNLAPAGYTNAIISALWPEGSAGQPSAASDGSGVAVPSDSSGTSGQISAAVRST